MVSLLAAVILTASLLGDFGGGETPGGTVASPPTSVVSLEGKSTPGLRGPIGVDTTQAGQGSATLASAGGTASGPGGDGAAGGGGQGGGGASRGDPFNNPTVDQYSDSLARIEDRLNAAGANGR